MNHKCKIIIGIDTHKATHVAVALDLQGTRLAALSIPTNPKGYLELERWSQSLGEVHAFGIEGTGSYGAGLSRSLLPQGHKVVEVTRPNRQLRYTQGKTDTLGCRGGRTIRSLRPGEINNPMASAKAAMRALARRWLWLHEEIIPHEKELERLVPKCAPDLMTSQGITTLTVAEMLVVVRGDPTRIRSEAAFAKLCGVCPIPASSGKTHRFRFNRGGNRQANAALHRVAIVRIRSHEPTLLMSGTAQSMERKK